MNNTALVSSDLEECIKRESDAHEAVARIAAEYAKAGAPVAHIGDGNCGYLIDLIKMAMEERGLYESKPVAKKGDYQKVVISTGLRKSVFERDQYRCKHCGTHLDLTVDHIVPERKGGMLSMGNLQTLCRPCNSKKGVA